MDESLPPISRSEIDEAIPLLKIKNAVLDTAHFMSIRDQSESYNALYKFTQINDEVAPTLASSYRSFPPEDKIKKHIDKVLEKNAQIKSTASSDLKSIRQEIAKKRVVADRLFYKALKRCEKEGILGDIRESVSNSRRVLAVNAPDKNKAKGAFHGSSAKNTLVFLEPNECLEINATVGVLIEEERREIRRILLNLTREMAPFSEKISITNKKIIELDVLFAKTRFAKKENAHLPEITENEIAFNRAVNPVLKKTQEANSQEVVPLDLYMDKNNRLVVVSGPNAGGKSLVLKTVGLLQIILQCGILVPVGVRTKMKWFEKIMTDIGDPQSIESELSTYSGKLSKMKEILRHSDDKTLCLVDEFGSGSDPDLGSSLARVFLSEIHKSNAFGIFTTHFNNIKALAQELSGASNANMSFDIESLKPQYTIQQGTPGSSYTFEVAERSGISKRIMAEAKKNLKEQTLSFDRLIVVLQNERKSLESTQKQVRAKLKDLESLKQINEKRIQEIETKLSKTGKNNTELTQQINWGKRMERWANLWSKAKTQKRKKEVQDKIIKSLSERNYEVRARKKKEQMQGKKAAKKALENLLLEPVKTGDKVKVLGGGAKKIGEVIEIRKDKFLVSLGDVLSTWLKRKEFVHVEPTADKKLKSNEKKMRAEKQNVKFVKKKENPIKTQKNGK
jgi:DNA mismatch repair protein MutS2